MYISERKISFYQASLSYDLAICGAAEQKVFTLDADGTWPGFSICLCRDFQMELPSREKSIESLLSLI